MSRRLWHALALAIGPAMVVACQEPYRVGEYVWVEWEPGSGVAHPAYVVERKGSRFRVHYEGYDLRWDEDVTLDRIKGRIEAPVTNPPPPPSKVTRAAGGPRALASGSASSMAAANPYKPGDRLRVRWRGSPYPATVIAVEGPDKLRVHYEGHEPAWDEVVDLERVVGRR